MEKILVIEDDRATGKALKQVFEPEGYAVELARDGAAGLAAVRNSRPDFVVLDLKLPVMPGPEVCREIKKEFPEIPIVIVSAVADEVDKVQLLELGADDYVTKPFSPKELLARVHAVLRRSQRGSPGDHFRFGDVVVDFPKMELNRAGSPVPMTPQEFKVLKYFAENTERVVSREEFLNVVWGYNSYPSTRTVDSHILTLRQKLEKDPANPVHFLTVHHAGYKFVP